MGNAAYSVLLALHLLAAVGWVGGMAFAHFALRPSLGQLHASDRLALMAQVLERFLSGVAVAAVVLPVTGYILIFGIYGGFGGVGWHVHVMQALGWIMILLFLHLRFAPYRRFRRALEAGDRATAAGNLDMVRRIVAINLALGTAVVVVAALRV